MIDDFRQSKTKISKKKKTNQNEIMQKLGLWIVHYRVSRNGTAIGLSVTRMRAFFVTKDT
jgi:hypothetical protein